MSDVAAARGIVPQPQLRTGRPEVCDQQLRDLGKHVIARILGSEARDRVFERADVVLASRLGCCRRCWIQPMFSPPRKNCCAAIEAVLGLPADNYMRSRLSCK